MLKVNSSQVPHMECQGIQLKRLIQQNSSWFRCSHKAEIGVSGTSRFKRYVRTKISMKLIAIRKIDCNKNKTSVFLVSCTTRTVVQCCSPPHPILADCKSSHMNVCGHLVGIKAEWVHFSPNLQPLRLQRLLPDAFVDLVAFVKIVLITVSAAASH